jgi:hypothetical protein
VGSASEGYGISSTTRPRWAKFIPPIRAGAPFLDLRYSSGRGTLSSPQPIDGHHRGASMLKRTEPALTEITQHITIERTVGVEPEVAAQWHTTHGLEKN